MYLLNPASYLFCALAQHGKRRQDESALRSAGNPSNCRPESSLRATDSMAEKETIRAVMESIISFTSSHIYLSLAVLILTPLCIFRLLKSQPRSLWKLNPLKISEVRHVARLTPFTVPNSNCRCQIYIYPIKSLRGSPVPQAVATKNGFEYDRKSISPGFSTHSDLSTYL